MTRTAEIQIHSSRVAIPGDTNIRRDYIYTGVRTDIRPHCCFPALPEVGQRPQVAIHTRDLLPPMGEYPIPTDADH